jgi:hypothetical protein
VEHAHTGVPRVDSQCCAQERERAVELSRQQLRRWRRWLDPDTDAWMGNVLIVTRRTRLVRTRPAGQRQRRCDDAENKRDVVACLRATHYLFLSPSVLVLPAAPCSARHLLSRYRTRVWISRKGKLAHSSCLTAGSSSGCSPAARQSRPRASHASRLQARGRRAAARRTSAHDFAPRPRGTASTSCGQALC